MKNLLTAAVFAGVSAAVGAQSPSLQIIPASPRYQEPVYVRITPPPFAPGNIWASSVSMSGTTISVAYREYPDIGGNIAHDVELGRFPAGSYSVRVQSELGTAPVTTQFVVSPSERSEHYPGTVPAVNYTGMWYQPTESGWGISINQGATNELFAVWFTYDSASKPVWYAMEPGGWISASTFSVYSGPIYRYAGPYFGGPFDPSRVVGEQAGTGSLSFRDSSNGRFTYMVDGVSGTKLITRLPVE